MKSSVSCFKADSSDSAYAFKTLVWPIVRDWIGGGKLVQMESVTDSKFANLLDMNAGIDAWQVHQNGMRGIASRIQVADRPFNTFTIRESRDSGVMTDYDKRRIAIESKGIFLYPNIMVQAYLESWCGPVISVGMAETIDIIDYIQKQDPPILPTSNAKFYVCSWDKMEKLGYRVIRT